MKIPEFVGIEQFAAALEHNRDMVNSVLKTFDAGAFYKTDLEKLAMAARRTAFVCDQLVKWQRLKMLVESAAQKDELDGFSWD